MKPWKPFIIKFKVKASLSVSLFPVFFPSDSASMAKKRAQPRSEQEKVAVMILMLTIIILVLRHFVYAWAAGRISSPFGAGPLGAVKVSEMNLEEMTDRIHKLEDSNKKKDAGVASIFPRGAVSRPNLLVTFAGTVAEDALRPGHLIRGMAFRQTHTIHTPYT